LTGGQRNLEFRLYWATVACLTPILAISTAAGTWVASGEPTKGDSTLVRPDSLARTFTLGEITVESRRSYSAAGNEAYQVLDFALRPHSTTQELLQVVPGLFIAQHAGGGKAEQIFLRGFDADHGTDINISVDGVPVNMVSHGHGQGYADLHFVIPEAIAEMEVMKGPYYVRYGDLATAGAVSFRTFDRLPVNTLKADIGSFGTARAVGLVNLFSAQKLRGYGGAEYYRTRGYFDAEQDLQRWNWLLKIHYQAPVHQFFAFSYFGHESHWDASGQIPARAVSNGSIGRFGSIDPTEGGQTSRHTFLAQFNDLSSLDEPLSIAASFTRYTFQLFSNFTFFKRDPVSGDQIEQTDSRSLLTLNISDTRRWSLGKFITGRTTAGAGLRADNIVLGMYHTEARRRTNEVNGSDVKQRNLSAFAEHELFLGETIRILAGLRADYFSFVVDRRLTGGGEAVNQTGSAHHLVLSPKFNIAYAVLPQWELYLNSGYGFHSNDARVAVLEKNQPTLPRAFGAEVGTRINLREKVSLAAALWRLDLEQEFVWSSDEATTEERGRTRRYGMEIESRYQPTSWFVFDADVTLAHGFFRDTRDGENGIPLAPRLTFAGGITMNRGRVQGSLRARHLGNRPANPEGTVIAHGYTVMDLSLGYTVSSRWKILATVQNAFDVEWNEAQFDTESRLKGESQPVSELHFTPGTPRNVRFGLTFHF